jgi:hypothetical protein
MLSPSLSPKTITNHLFWIWYWYLETVCHRGLGNDLNRSQGIIPFGDERSNPRGIDLLKTTQVPLKLKPNLYRKWNLWRTDLKESFRFFCR